MSRRADRIPAPPTKVGTRAAARAQAGPLLASRPPLSQILQLRAAQSARTDRAAAPERGGLPGGLKTGIERLSGIAMDDVRVHRNSPAPARLGALAYTKGSEIHLGPGQDRHLAHEAWHVVQQKQGRVRATLQRKGVALNDDAALELEADAMGARASAHGESEPSHPAPAATPGQSREASSLPVQLKRLAPKKSDKATDPAQAGETASPDPQTPKMWRYTTAITDKKMKTRAEALTALADVYGVAGKGFKAENAYLSRNTLTKHIQVNRLTDPELFKRFSKDGDFSADANKKNKAALDLDSFRGEADIPLVDPVCVEAEGLFEKDAHSTYSITATIRFSEEFDGYVIGVKDSALEVDDTLTKARKPYGSEGDVQQAGRQARANLVKGSYSNTHHKPKAEAEVLGDVLTAARAQNRTLEAVERGVDAICKFIAESGRFRAARALGSGLSDKSMFYCQVDNKDEYKGISFKGLYLTWLTLFGRDYDIDDATLIATLKDPPQSKKTKMGDELVAMDDAERHIKTFKKATAAAVFHAGASHYDLDAKAVVQGSPPPKLVPAPVVVPLVPQQNAQQNPVAVSVLPAPPQPQPSAPPSVDPKAIVAPSQPLPQVAAPKTWQKGSTIRTGPKKDKEELELPVHVTALTASTIFWGQQAQKRQQAQVQAPKK